MPGWTGWPWETSVMRSRSAMGLPSCASTTGLGYRLYCMQRGMQVVVMLCGGDKSSQARDIDQAKRIAQEWEEQNHG